MAIKINFSENDLKVSSGSYEALPAGEYKANITGIEIKEVSNNSSANYGKPYFAVTATISEDEYVGRLVFFSVMLFSMEKGNWFLNQFLRACGMEDSLESGVISDDPEDYLGLDVTLKLKRKVDAYRQKKLEEADEWDGNPIYRNEVASISGPDEDVEDVPSPAGKKPAAKKPSTSRATKKKDDFLPL